MKRIRTLAVPYIIWVSLFWIFALVVSNLHRMYQGTHYNIFFLNLEQWGLWYENCPFLTPLWYVRGLFLLVLISPLFVWLLRRLGACALLLLFFLYGALCPYAPMPYWTEVQSVTRCGIFPVLGVFYFTLGMAIRMEVVKLKPSRSCALFAIGCSCILMFARTCFNDNYISPYLGMISIPFALYGVWHFMPSHRWPQWIVANSFAVFLIHKFVLLVVTHFVITGRSVFVYFSVATIAFFISLVIANVMRKLMPKVFGVMTGGR